MNFFQALLMGLVQGLTEFLPVSSSGHLAIARHLLHISTDVSPLFEALLHVGTLGAIFIVLWSDIRLVILEALKLVRDLYFRLVKKESLSMYPERKLVIFILLSSVPTALIGLLFEHFLEDLFLSSLLAVGVCLLITAATLWLIKRMPAGHKDIARMKARDSVFIGIVQGIATLPGISRSGSTISAGLFAGLEQDFAFRYSFLISIPAILGGTLLKLLKASASDLSNLGSYLAGTLVSAVVGFFAIRFIRVLLKSDRFHYFAYYCAGVGLLAIIAGIFIR